MKQYRKARGLSLQALADIVEVSKVHIWQIEHGMHAPSLALVQKFVDRTDLKADDFLRKQDSAAE